MDIIKYCKEEHNIQLGCHTLQLGTFDYYRNLDPEFSIADAEEGSIKYFCNSDNDLVINSRQFNAITGGGAKITDKDSPNPPSSVDAVKIKMQGGEYVGQPDGTVKIKPGEVETEVFYPNSYVFCCSILDAGVEPDPKSVSDEYNSFYKIKSSKINEFANSICQLIAQNILIGDLKLESEKILDSHILSFGQTPIVKCIHGPVKYTDDKTVILSSPEDFDEHNWMKIFFQSMLKKDSKYFNDKEYRFVFIIEHPVHRFLPVLSKPKILDLNPITSMLG